MQITVDRSKCCGSSQCVEYAPGIFDQDDDEGLVVILDADPGPDRQPQAREAAIACPTGAITVDG